MNLLRLRTVLASLAIAASPILADPTSPPAIPDKAPSQDRERRGVMMDGHHHHVPGDPSSMAWRHPDLELVADHSGMIFDGVLVHKQTFTPPGARILVTEYTFEVREWFQGQRGDRFITIREAGGVQDAGDDGATIMTTCRSHRLELDGRYVLFVRRNVDESLIPFNRILQVMDAGQTVADERGRFVVELRNGRIITRTAPDVRSLSYTPVELQPYSPMPTLMPPPAPDPGFDPLPPQPDPTVIVGAPIPAEVIFQALRPKGAVPPATPQPAGHASHTGGQDWIRCGHIDRSTNFANLLPNQNNWNWTQSGGGDWNDLVDTSHRHIFGSLLIGGEPIRNEAPSANDGRHHRGVPTSTQMINGGYGGGWANWNNANGLCFRWYAFPWVGCPRIRETDVFANPTIANNELQFRKTMVHELGHALGFDHEDRFVSIMVSGTWRVPPNYVSNRYNRTDEMHGGRAMLDVASSQWTKRNWRDMETISQSHPNWGSSGDVGPHMTRLSTYSANTGQQVSLQRIYVGNRGNVSFSQNVTFRIYLSTTTNISTSDHLVWSGGWPSFAAESVSNNFDLQFTIPASVPTGNYYVGWIVGTSEGELEAGNNTGLLRGTSGSGFSPLQISINQVQQTGACCFTLTGTCAIRTAAECSAQLGSYAGNNVTCAAANCPQAGACCFADGSCSQRTAVMCALQNGTFSGQNVSCAAANCPQPGACCMPDGTCQVLAALECSLEGGNYIGDGTTCAGVTCPTVGTEMEIPPFQSTFSSASLTRGMWFQAPADFIITGLRVPDESDHGLQNVEVVRLAEAPPAWSSTTENFISLARHVGILSGRVVPVNIPVSKGDIIGILGACGDETMMHNSYSSVNPFETTICGQPTELRRLGMQFNLASQPAQSLWTETSSVVTRIEVYYAGALGAGVVTTLPPNNGRSDSGAGAFFDLEPNHDVAINGFAYYSNIPAGTHAAVEIYTRAGTYSGFIGSSSGWSLHERVDLISKGSQTPTPVHLSKPLHLAAGETRGIYFVGATGGLRYFGTGSTSEPNQGNAHLSFYGEHARGGPPWEGPLFTPRAWSGSIYYTILGETQVVPTGYANTSGNAGRNTLVRDLPRTIQFVIGASELSGVPAGTPITGVSWRAYPAATSPWPETDAYWEHYDISVSTSRNPPGSFSTTFANNIGADNIVVRCGSLTIPAGSFTSGGNPNAFGFEIPFNRAFIYNGGDLLFTIRHNGNITGTNQFMDHLSSATPGWGQRFYYIDATSFTATTGAAATFPITQLTLGHVPTAIITNMPGNDGTSSASLQGGRIKAMGFSMPAGEDYLLENIEMRLNITSLGVEPLVRIFDDVGGQPVNELLTLVNPPISTTGINTYQFLSPTAFMLEAGTNYWVVVYNTGDSSLSWTANSPAITPTGIATHFGSLFSATGGPNPPTEASSILNSYVVHGSPVGDECYADCNGDQILSVDDFTCFINAFASAQALPVQQQITHYANCTGSTSPPILTVDDFTCYINAFAQGCP